MILVCGLMINGGKSFGGTAFLHTCSLCKLHKYIIDVLSVYALRLKGYTRLLSDPCYECSCSNFPSGIIDKCIVVI